MNERQRWRPEEDAVLSAYVKEYGPREWHLVSQRMNVSLNRDAKSCLERWKNYLKPGIKRGSLTEEEKGLVISLQAEHGNKWKRIAAEVPGRTPKRLGKWWEVYKERQHREELKENKSIVDPIEQQRRYDRILETFAEKLAREQSYSPLMVTSNGFLPSDPPALLPAWLSSSSSNGPANPVRPPSPSVTLTLSPSSIPTAGGLPWLPHPAERPSSDNNKSNLVVLGNLGHQISSVDGSMASELVECFRELEEGHRAWMVHKKETAWRLRRVELQLESEKATKRREKMEETESKVKALREEQRATLERIEAEYKEQILGLRRDAEAKEQKLVEQWTAKHLKVAKFLEQMGCRMPQVQNPRAGEEF